MAAHFGPLESWSLCSRRDFFLKSGRNADCWFSVTGTVTCFLTLKKTQLLHNNLIKFWRKAAAASQQMWIYLLSSYTYFLLTVSCFFFIFYCRHLKVCRVTWMLPTVLLQRGEWHAWPLTVENRIQGTSQQEVLHSSSAENQFGQNDCRFDVHIL